MPYRKAFFRQVGAMLSAHGVQLVVYSGDDRSIFDGDPAYSLAPVHIALGSAVKQSISAQDISENLVIPNGLFRALWQSRADLFVTEDISALPANLAMPVNRLLRGTPYLIWTLGLSIPGKRRSWWRIFFVPVILALRGPASGFIVYSRWAKAQVENRFRKPVFVAPNSTVGRDDIVNDLSGRIERLRSGSPLQLIFIGRLTAQKKVDILLEALALTDSDMMLHIVGDGDARDYLEKYARELGLTRRVRFHGEVRDRQLKDSLVDAADLGIMPGLGGLFVQELHSRGCPVIAGIADGTEQDLVKNITPHLYLENPGAAEITEKLQHAASNRELLVTYANAVTEYARESHNADIMAENWVAAVMRQLTLRP
jgi:glycosyltransferase involved in cell wall biosynthesis